MDYNCLKIEQRGQICILAISEPKSLNALSTKVILEMDKFIDSIDVNSTRVLIITGDGDKSFVAGADIAEMKDKNQAEALEFAKLGAGVFRKIETLDIPVIAAVNGYCLGGGCELAMACDIRIASAKARFGQPEVGLGIIPGFSGTYRLAKHVGSAIAKELIYTGKTIKADEALRIGLVNSISEPENLMADAFAMAETIASKAPIAIRHAKKCIDAELDLAADDAIAYENDLFSQLFATEDQKEGMTAFMAKRAAEFKNK